MSNLPHLVAGLNAEREKRMQAPIPSRPAQQHAFGPSGTTSSDYNEGGRYDPQLRAVSDPNRPPPRPKTSFEIELERGDEARIARRVHVKKEDLIKRDAEIAAAEEEIRARVASITAKGVEITRRLDYGYYNLLETAGNVVAIITSFQSLSRQSEQLITNFDKETRRLDADTRKRVEAFKSGFEARDGKVQALAERGKRASTKAEDLSIRLENARLIVQNWERREDQVKKVWGHVFGAVWWTSIAVFVLVILVFLAKEWWFHGDPVKAGLVAHNEGSWNQSLRLGGSEGSIAGYNERLLLQGREGTPGAKVPEDVRRLLLDIAEKNRRRKVMFPTLPTQPVDGGTEADDRLNIRRTPKESKNHEITTRIGSLPFSIPGSTDRDRDQEDPRLKMLDDL
ncbi:hypothetical protein A1O3_09358 [Capronia epimyces CBS 606.96]|uniref:Uncharacterized protein n=1 Tax=Capronia epimyces CBS 606.96 TaxID=1182542 RepID=W9XCH7_9EURO|nr:uncharacterized protein A1O3_09358 [Capronia epimyces CBS 606.96]EXJ78197.1 hypothetical protein A1O3_09358 [Capronia epimyces CBS 606.96]